MIFGSSMQESRTSTGPVLGDLPRVDSSQTTSCGSDLNAERSVLMPTFLLSDSTTLSLAPYRGRDGTSSRRERR